VQIDDFWQYALDAMVACIRPANRVGVPVGQHARTWPSSQPAQRHNDQWRAQ